MYSDEFIQKLDSNLIRLRSESLRCQIVLTDLAGKLPVKAAANYLREGVARRASVVARCVNNIFDIYPPGRRDFLSNDECDNVAIQMHAFAINVYAIFDNIAWVCVLSAGANVAPLDIGLYKKQTKDYIPDELKSYLGEDSSSIWYKTYAKSYRDSVAHRIPPYLPSRVYTPEESLKCQELEALAHSALLNSSINFDASKGKDRLDYLAEHENFLKEKNSLGQNCKFIAISEIAESAGSPIYLHPQIISDWMLVNELVLKFDSSFRVMHGMPLVSFPAGM